MTLLALLTVAATLPTFGQAPDPVPDTRQGEQIAEVEAVITRLFDGMRARDTAIVRSTLHSEARLMTAGTDSAGAPVIRSTAIDAFVAGIGAAEVELDERLFDTETRVSGNLASVWTSYDFYVGGRFSHCGVDAFQLARVADGWRILQITDTRQRAACPSREG